MEEGGDARPRAKFRNETKNKKHAKQHGSEKASWAGGWLPKFKEGEKTFSQ